ncbi:MAG: DUF2934 domain-containing protein [Pseudomonadota bacterium]|nr:DUF2934 domain-containing protein [Pseudomonadota bacterium]
MTEEKTPKRKTAKPKEKSVADQSATEKSVGKRKAPARPSAEASSLEAGAPAAGTVFTPSDRQLMIEREAYLRAERRGFEPGHELEDWLAAEHSLGARADA